MAKEQLTRLLQPIRLGRIGHYAPLMTFPIRPSEQRAAVFGDHSYRADLYQ